VPMASWDFEYELPNLQSLILQRYTNLDVARLLDDYSTSLTFLRLIDVEMQYSSLTSTSRITHLELINVSYSGDGCALRSLLKDITDTLGYLSLVNVGGPDFSILVDHLSFLHSLRGLCIGPYAFGLQENIGIRFPSSLEHLTIWELLHPKLTSQTLIGRTSNKAGLEAFLGFAEISTPNLRIIRVRGAHYVWAPWKSEITGKCLKHDIAYELSAFKFQSIIAEEVSRRQRTWKYLTSIFKR